MKTERKQDIQEIQSHLQSHLANIVQSSGDAIISKTIDGKIVYWNIGSEKIFGYKSSEVLGKSINIIAPHNTDEHTLIVKKYQSGEKLEHYETKRVRKDKAIIDVSLTVSPIFDDKNKIVGFSTIARDITGKALYSQYARSLIEASLDPLVTISADGKITDVNEASIKVTGFPREKLIGTDFSNYFTEPAKAQAGYQQVFEKGFVTDYPLIIRHQNGKLTDVLYNASVYKDDKGNVLGVFAAARDITQQKEAEKQIQKIQTYTRMLIETSLDPQITKGTDGLITDVNEATILVTGVPRDKIIGTHFPNYFTEPKNAEKAYQEAFAKGVVRNIPLAIKHISGKVTDVLYNATVYKDELGNVQGVFASARDITDRIKSEEEIKKNQVYTRSLIEASLDPLVTISADGKITDVNEASVKVTGFPREKLIGTDFSNYFTEPAKAQAGYQQVFKKGFVTDYPLIIRHQNGKLTDVLYNASVYKDDKGNVLGVFAAARDITVQKQLAEREIAEREKELMRIEELERFRKLTVGRELKMIELKKEIEGLKIQIDVIQKK